MTKAGKRVMELLQSGTITVEDFKGAVIKEWISEQEFEEITGEQYEA